MIKGMKEKSKKAIMLPDKFYHATSFSNLSGILEKGIIPDRYFGSVYFCDEAENCIRFVRPPYVIFEIDPKKLNRKELYISYDHDREIYDFECYAYYGKVLISAISNVHVPKEFIQIKPKFLAWKNVCF